MESTSLVLNKMDSYIQTWKSSDDSRYVFLSCYHMMSGNMVNALASDEFHDAGWVKKLLNIFADYYFENLVCYDCGDKASKVWEHTHKATQNDDLSHIQHLILGVNAHINYDLVLALHDMLTDEWDTLSESEKEQRYQDHCHVNKVIARTIDKVQDEILEPLNPSLDWIDKLFGRVDELLISKLISSWRTTVWENTQELLQAGSAEDKEQIRLRLEENVLGRAEVISFF